MYGADWQSGMSLPMPNLLSFNDWFGINLCLILLHIKFLVTAKAFPEISPLEKSIIVKI